MSEAFKRHIPLWIILLVLCLGAVVIVASNDGSELEPADETADANQSVGGVNFPKLDLNYVAGGFIAPVGIVSGVGADTELYIVEKGGKIRLLNLNDGKIGPVFLDISTKVIDEGEQGLLGFVFDPNYETNKYIYINYVRPTNSGRETVIARYQVERSGSGYKTQKSEELLSVAQPFRNHNAGDLHFGPDGYLYVTLGDGGSGGDPNNNAQNGKSLLGKILRLDVSGAGGYKVPADNPFIKDDDYRPEIWSLGWRNPWRFSFDPLNGDMWVADVGQNKAEEINHEPANTGGRNYGWRCYEGANEHNLQSGCKNKSNYTFPVAQYPHEGSSCRGSVTGGYVYRGEAYATLRGFYIYGDYCKGRIYLLDSSQATYTANLIKQTDLSISTFGRDSRGELYLADAAKGQVFKVVVP
ncbi:MAG TPA: PQQ-dependent sugar dehydrogenase [Candidatus Saccharimonadales bacterium]